MDTLKIKEILAKYGLLIGVGLVVIVMLVGYKKRSKLKMTMSNMRKRMRNSKLSSRMGSMRMRMMRRRK